MWYNVNSIIIKHLCEFDSRYKMIFASVLMENDVYEEQYNKMENLQI